MFDEWRRLMNSGARLHGSRYAPQDCCRKRDKASHLLRSCLHCNRVKLSLTFLQSRHHRHTMPRIPTKSHVVAGLAVLRDHSAALLVVLHQPHLLASMPCSCCVSCRCAKRKPRHRRDGRKREHRILQLLQNVPRDLARGFGLSQGAMVFLSPMATLPAPQRRVPGKDVGAGTSAFLSSVHLLEGTLRIQLW